MTQYYCDQAMQVLENISDGFYSVDSEWRILYVNRRAELNWSMSRSELVGRVLWDVFPPNKRIKGSQELIRAMVDRTPVSFETFSPFLKTYVEVHAYPNQFGGIEVYFHNITDRKLAAEAVQTTDQLLRIAIDATGIGFWEWDMASDTFSTIYTSPNMPMEWHNNTIGESMETIHPEDHDRVRAALMDAKHSGRQYKCEYRRILRDGTVAWIYGQGEVIQNLEGLPVRMLGINLDVTEQKDKLMQEKLLQEAEATARRERELLEILDGAADGSWIMDMVTKTKTNSMKWKKTRGTEHLSPSEEFLLDIEKIHPDDRERVMQTIDGAFAKKLDRAECEYRVNTVEKGYIWVLARAKFTYDTEGMPYKMYGACTDITQRKQLELTILEKNQLILNFFSNISHEFKTPLTVLLLAIDLINVHFGQANCQFKDRMEHDMAVLRQNVYRMHKLISNLLDITKLDAGFMCIRINRVDISKLVRELVESVQGVVHCKDITIQYVEHGDGLVAPMDSDKLERILLNLLSNAVKYTKPGGQVTVRMRATENSILFSVVDNGVGIPEDMQPVVFDRFRQVDQSRTRGNEGCGIGLSLTKALVELLRGRIWFHSEPGCGSEFFVELPVLGEEEVCGAMVVDTLPVSRMVEMEFSDVFLR